MTINKFAFRRRPASAPKITAADRNGIRGNILDGHDDNRPLGKDPQVDKPAFMINQIRYVGAHEGTSPAEAMTPKAHALYEFLMASARVELKDKNDFMVSFADAKTYLDVPRADRITGYMDDITNTWVEYDYKDKGGWQRTGRMQLLQCEESTSPEGEKFIRYAMHPGVRTLILESVQYTWLELAAFAKFKCRYTARLYPKFALRAGMSGKYHEPLTWEPEAIAREIGWPSVRADFHFGHFESRVIKPVMDDIRQFVKRFSIDYDRPVRGTGRGRPVTGIVFHVSEKMKVLADYKMAAISEDDRAHIHQAAKREGLDLAKEMPSDLLLRKGATKAGMTTREIGSRWADAFARSWHKPDEKVGKIGFHTGRQLRMIFTEEGVGRAFEEWLVDYDFPVKPANQVTAPVAKDDPAPAPAVKPKLQKDADGYYQLPDSVFRNLPPAPTYYMPFKDASKIVVRLHDWLRPEIARDDVVRKLESQQFVLDAPNKIFRIEYDRGKYMERVVPIHPIDVQMFMAGKLQMIESIKLVA